MGVFYVQVLFHWSTKWLFCCVWKQEAGCNCFGSVDFYTLVYCPSAKWVECFLYPSCSRLQLWLWDTLQHPKQKNIISMKRPGDTKRTFGSSGFSTEGTLISASTVPYSRECRGWGMFWLGTDWRLTPSTFQCGRVQSWSNSSAACSETGQIATTSKIIFLMDFRSILEGLQNTKDEQQLQAIKSVLQRLSWVCTVSLQWLPSTIQWVSGLQRGQYHHSQLMQLQVDKQTSCWPWCWLNPPSRGTSRPSSSDWELATADCWANYVASRYFKWMKVPVGQDCRPMNTYFLTLPWPQH